MKWSTRALDSIATLDRQSIHPSEVEAATPYLGLEHLDGDGGIYCNQTVGSASLKSNKFQFSDRHVLFGKLRPYLRKIVRPVFSGVCSTDIIPILPKDGVSRDYLFYFLRTPGTVDLATSRCSGANLPRLGPRQLASFQIPLPPFEEQKRIAGILDAADALRAKRREALGQLDTLLQSTFLGMFGDPVTNPMGWEQRHLPEIVSKRKNALKRGPFGGALKKEIFVAEGFKVYEQKNVIYDDFDIGSYFIKKSDYERLSPFKVSSHDLLISCSGTIGRIAAVPLHAAPGVMNQALLKIDLDESAMLNSFFLSLWRSQSFERQVLGMTHGTGMKNMKSMAELKGINFVAPPLELQHRFATIVESVKQQRARQRAHLAELDILFASLQSRAFRGDL